jgi:predicted CoA-binding protein
MKPTIAIIGASNNRRKFGNRAVRAYIRQGFEVFPIHPTAKSIEGLTAYSNVRHVPIAHLDRVSFYVPPEVGVRVIEDVASKSVGEVWLNPGSESPALQSRATDLGLNIILGCSILDVGEDPAQV